MNFGGKYIPKFKLYEQLFNLIYFIFFRINNAFKHIKTPFRTRDPVRAYFKPGEQKD